MTITRNQLLLLFFIIIGAILRFYNIGFQDTNWDEQFTMSFTATNLSAIQVLYNSFTMDYTPPFYYLSAHFSMLLFGQNPTAIRIPSAIFGILLIPVMYLIGKEYKDELYGLLLAGLTTFFYNFIFYSKYGRSYSMALVWFSLAFLFFMRVLKGDKRSAIYFSIVAVCSMWTHLYSAIPIGLMILYLLWKKREIISSTLIILFIGCLPLLQYINLILVTRCSSGDLCKFAGTNSFGATPYQILFFAPFDVLGYSAIVIGIVVAVTLWKHHNEEMMRVITNIVILTWLSMFILSLKTPIVIHYLIFILPMVLMVFILPIWEQIKNGRWKIRYIMVVLLIVVLELFQIYLVNFVQRMGNW